MRKNKTSDLCNILSAWKFKSEPKIENRNIRIIIHTDKSSKLTENEIKLLKFFNYDLNGSEYQEFVCNKQDWKTIKIEDK